MSNTEKVACKRSYEPFRPYLDVREPDYVDLGDNPILVDVVGFVPLHKRIEKLIRSGEILESHNRAIYGSDLTDDEDRIFETNFESLADEDTYIRERVSSLVEKSSVASQKGLSADLSISDSNSQATSQNASQTENLENSKE
ncbi:hypothetical protein [Capybara microvirus Cap1_SP_216]|nr:hypothetical protein [Capybara microvirus Cap1_SP_216]